MTSYNPGHHYVLLTRLNPAGNLAPLSDETARWEISVAAPAEGSTQLRDKSELVLVESFPDALVEVEARVAANDLEIVMDLQEIRVFGAAGLSALRDRIVEEIHDDLDEPEGSDGDALDADFEAHPLSALHLDIEGHIEDGLEVASP